MLRLGAIKKKSKLSQIGSVAMSGVSAIASKNPFKIMNTLQQMANLGKDSSKQQEEKISPAEVIMLSGCKDQQTSADATIHGKHTGAMSHAFVTALSSNPRQSYAQLLQSTRQILSGKFSQIPQLSTSHPMEMNQLFIM